jgi:hypothetical protein
MKTLLISIGIFISIFLIIYLIIAFIYGNIDLFNAPEVYRGLVGLFGGVIGGVSGLAYYIES